MDRKTVLGLIIIGVIVIAYTMYFTPDPEPEPPKTAEKDLTADTISRQEVTTDSIAQVSDTTISDSTTVAKNDTSEIRANYGKFKPPLKEEQALIIIENDQLRITLTNKGGAIHTVELKKYRTFDSLPVILIDPDNHSFDFTLPLGNTVISTSELFFQTKGKSFKVEGNDSASISFRLNVDENTWLEHSYTLHGNSSMVDYKITLNNLDQYIPKHSYFTMFWNVMPRKQEMDIKNERRLATQFYKYFDDNDVTRLSITKSYTEKVKDRVEWVGFRQQFFMGALISEEGFEEAVLEATKSDDSVYIKLFKTKMILPYKNSRQETHHMKFVFGPNHYRTLKQTGYQLQVMVPLGWGIFGWVNKFFIIPIFNFLGRSIASYGLIIFIMTIFIKLILTPLTYKSYVSMAKMNLLKPEIEALKKKYNNDMKKVSPEQLKLFQKAGVNPLGGCLPMLLQMPILIAMYRFFPASIELRQEAFLWATDLSTYDSIYDFPNNFSIRFYGDHISLFTLLMTASTFLYTYMNNKMTAVTNPQMKYMMYFMPIMLLGFFNNFSSALTYYYFLFNIFGFAQQYILKKFFINETKLREKLKEKQNKPRKKSGLARRLEEVARKRQQEARKRK